MFTDKNKMHNISNKQKTQLMQHQRTLTNTAVHHNTITPITTHLFTLSNGMLRHGLYARPFASQRMMAVTYTQTVSLDDSIPVMHLLVLDYAGSFYLH